MRKWGKTDHMTHFSLIQVGFILKIEIFFAHILPTAEKI